MAAQKINEAHEHIAKAEKWWARTKTIISCSVVLLLTLASCKATVYFLLKGYAT